MASIKLYLDTRSPKKDGTFPLKLAVNHRGSFLINLKVYLAPEQWIGDEVILPGDLRQQKVLNEYIQSRYTTAKNIIYKQMALGMLSNMSDKDLRQLLDTNAPIKTEASVLFKDHLEVFAARKERPRVKALYLDTLKKISGYSNADVLTFEDMNLSWLRGFDGYMSKTCATNTRAIHFKNIRAVFNDAIDEEIIGQGTYPFRKFKIKREATRKRALTINDLRTLRDYPCEPHEEKYRDMFMLIFYLIGINTVDLFQLKEMKNNRVEYRRSKTGRLYDIEVLPEAMDIIKKYKGDNYLLDVLDTYADYRDFAHRMNNNLKRIGPKERVKNNTKPKGNRVKSGPEKVKHNGLFPDLSTYWARHTWATIAASFELVTT